MNGGFPSCGNDGAFDVPTNYYCYIVSNCRRVEMPEGIVSNGTITSELPLHISPTARSYCDFVRRKRKTRERVGSAGRLMVICDAPFERRTRSMTAPFPVFFNLWLPKSHTTPIQQERTASPSFVSNLMGNMDSGKGNQRDQDIINNYADEYLIGLAPNCATITLGITTVRIWLCVIILSAETSRRELTIYASPILSEKSLHRVGAHRAALVLKGSDMDNRDFHAPRPRTYLEPSRSVKQV
ncbi:hypothetical protein C8J56DRAFT_893658 [Mycena floridula]|nr:hypothetical protein C8J56DRAFT_893658 [Mycena floridula]